MAIKDILLAIEPADIDAEGEDRNQEDSTGGMNRFNADRLEAISCWLFLNILFGHTA